MSADLIEGGNAQGSAENTGRNFGKNPASGNSCAVSGSGDSPAQTERPLPSFRSEEELERHINAALQRMCAAPDRALKMQRWRELCALIDQRTPARRRFMARIAGLE